MSYRGQGVICGENVTVQAFQEEVLNQL